MQQLNDRTYLNPIVAGDHPDPTILKDGSDYYMTFSSFSSYPGLVIWHSTDLVDWVPIGPALLKSIGSVWAVDLCKHKGRYYIYIPAAKKGCEWSIYVIWSDDIRGPWSDPIDLGIKGCIDPGHIVGEDGARYLFVNGIRRIRLRPDGLATEGELEDAYSPWRYPEEWVVESFSPEGPKLLEHAGWFYLVTAVGGTAGPPTGHMVIVARSKSIHGPWEDCPHNPIVRTLSEDEPWWSRGHATLVEGPLGDWWMVYHGYENGFRTLGRQALLEPIEWTEDGWFRAVGGDLSKPLPLPAGGRLVRNGFDLSDDFRSGGLGHQWSFHEPGLNELERISFPLSGGLRLQAGGTSPLDSSPLTCGPVDRHYEAEITLTVDGEAETGLLLFYSHKAFVGVGFGSDELKTFFAAEEQPWMRQVVESSRIRIRLTNDHHVVTYRYSLDDGETWHLHGLRMEVSGIHHNVFGGFLSLKLGIYCSGAGSVLLNDFRYRGIETQS